MNMDELICSFTFINGCISLRKIGMRLHLARLQQVALRVSGEKHQMNVGG